MLSFRDRVALGDVQRLEQAGGGRRHGDLHLHALDEQQRVLGLHAAAGARLDAHHFSGNFAAHA